jgi:putative DNA primase/helicase
VAKKEARSSRSRQEVRTGPLAFPGGKRDEVSSAQQTAQDDFVKDAQPPAFTDEALALRFAEIYASRLRYVSPWGRWLEWNGQYWKFDETRHAFDLARAVCRVHSAEANEAKTSRNLASAKTVAAVHSLAMSDRRLAATTDQWDADSWALNTPGGVLDLRAGALRAHRPEHYMTKITAVAPDGTCPLWKQFLQRITDGNRELQTFLQVICGYALTGITTEHALFFFHGLGANGKSVFINTVSGILGDYHRTAPMETFTATGDRHPTDLAGLRGSRLVTASETEEGRKWAEAKIKALTGGDKISARFMRQDFFEYQPQFKPWIAGNHRPGLRSVDEATRRRFNLVPFAVTIPPAERDQQLTEKLRAEWSGIFAWMVQGCLLWQKHGLQRPEAVRAATDDYLASEDALSAWMDERCIRKPDAFETSERLFRSWTDWAGRAGEPLGSLKRFSQALKDRHFAPHRTNTQRGFYGLQVVPGFDREF